MEVARKDGLLLVRELAAEVKNHLDFKINAVMVRAITIPCQNLLLITMREAKQSHHKS